MTRMRMLVVIGWALVALTLPASALAAGPSTQPATLLAENFESTTTASYVTSPDDRDWSEGSVFGYWKTWSYRKHGGLSSLWCAGTNPTAVSQRTYAKQSAGFATFPLTATADYYSSQASFWYLMPTLGQSDRNQFVPQWTADTSLSYGTSASLDTSTSWAESRMSLSEYNSFFRHQSLSRKAGEFQFQWIDVKEIDPLQGLPFVHTGEGPSVDDVVITGWKYGPVRSLAVTGTSGLTTLTWNRPWRSTAATSTEERPISYRVWRAPAGTTVWVELTTGRSADARDPSTFSDSTAVDGTAYTYAVQAWDIGAGLGYGEPRGTDKHNVTIASPVGGTTMARSLSFTIRGTSIPAVGTSVAQVDVSIRRADGGYFDGTGFSAGERWLRATGTGSWTLSAPIRDDGRHTYTITARATDNGVDGPARAGSSSPVTVRIDNVGPRIISARSLGRYGVELRFSEPLQRGSVGVWDFVSKLRLRRIISLSADGTRVRLATGPQGAGTLYRVSVSRGAIADAHGNPSVASTATFRGR